MRHHPQSEECVQNWNLVFGTSLDEHSQIPAAQFLVGNFLLGIVAAAGLLGSIQLSLRKSGRLRGLWPGRLIAARCTITCVRTCVWCHALASACELVAFTPLSGTLEWLPTLRRLLGAAGELVRCSKVDCGI
jgi:hypothetical protein